MLAARTHMRAHLTLAGLATLVAAGCSLKDLTELTDTNVTAEDTRLPESSDGLVSTTVAPDRVTYTYAAPPKLELGSGDVIVGKEGGGYLRRVTSASVEGNAIVALTEEAAITDAIANLQVSVPIDPNARRAAIPVIDLTGKVLFDETVQGVPVTVTVERGSLDFQPSLVLDLDIQRLKLKRIAATTKGTITLALDLKLTVGGSATFQRELDLSGPTANLYTYPFVFAVPTPIGPLPVAGTVELDAFAGLAATVTAQGSLTVGAEGSSSLALTAAWQDGAWSVDNEPSFTATLHRPQVQTLLTTGARVYVRPELRVKLYGVVGPYATVTPSLDASVTAGAPPAVSVKGCIAGKVGVAAKIFGIELADLAHDFAEKCVPLP